MRLVESLEQRRLLSVNLVNGDLIIWGTEGDDTYLFTQGSGQLTVSENGNITNWLDSAIDRIVVHLLHGDDFVDAEGVSINMRVLASGGNDTVITGSGDDVVIAGPGGNNYIVGNGGNDSLVGGDGHDTILGGDGNDTIRGGAGNDLLDAGEGRNVLFGDAGNDTLIGGTGADRFVGGTGIDLVTYAAHPAGVRITLDNVANDGMPGEGDNVGQDIEFIITTLYNDVVVGGPNVLRVHSGPGNDILVAGRGPVIFHAGAGNDLMYGSLGDDVFHGEAGTDTVSYQGRTEKLVLRLSGVAESGAEGERDLIGNDVENLIGGSYDDTLIGNGNDNVLNGGPGNDTLIGGWGNDTLIGGDGFDMADYSGRTEPQVLRIGEGSGIVGEIDMIMFDVEGIIGGDGNDWIQGSDADNLLIGGAGNDTIIGFEGNDTLIGGPGADVLGWDPTGGPDEARATAGDDVIYANDIDNNLDGSADIINDVTGDNVYFYREDEGDVVEAAVPSLLA